MKVNIEKRLRPNLLMSIVASLVYIAPYLWLIVSIITKDYGKLIVSALLTFPMLVLLTLTWCWYFYRRKNYKKWVKEAMKSLED